MMPLRYKIFYYAAQVFCSQKLPAMPQEKLRAEAGAHPVLQTSFFAVLKTLHRCLAMA